MTPSKEEHRNIVSGYFYACCPYCRTTLAQGRSGSDVFIKCPQCGKYIHIVINDETVTTKPKEK